MRDALESKGMQLNLLGNLGLEGSSFSRSKPLLVLAYLAVEGPTSRHELAILFFPNSKDNADALSTTLRRLPDRTTILLEQNGQLEAVLNNDVQSFISFIEQQDWQAALDTYKGHFLAGLTLSVGEELEEWVFSKREALAEMAVNAHFALAKQALLENNKQLAEKHLAKIQDFETNILISESQKVKLNNLKEQLTKENRGTPSNIPKSGTSFIGRENEIKAIHAQLQSPYCRLLTLHGPGGIGKSRLALEIAQNELNETNFQDGIYFLPLETIQDDDQVAFALAQALGIVTQADADPLEQVQRYIGNGFTLLIMDNFEHIVSSGSLLTRLLNQCPHLKIFATSRVRLNLEEEIIFSIEGLDQEISNPNDELPEVVSTYFTLGKLSP